MKKAEARIHIFDTVQLEQYCLANSAVPDDDEKPYVAYFQISGCAGTYDNMYGDCNKLKQQEQRTWGHSGLLSYGRRKP